MKELKLKYRDNDVVFCVPKHIKLKTDGFCVSCEMLYETLIADKAELMKEYTTHTNKNYMSICTLVIFRILMNLCMHTAKKGIMYTNMIYQNSLKIK